MSRAITKREAFSSVFVQEQPLIDLMMRAGLKSRPK